MKTASPVQFQPRIVLATVDFVLATGNVFVTAPDLGWKRQACDLLEPTGKQPLRLARGDKVLAWCPTSVEERPVILGRVGKTAAPPAAPEGTHIPSRLLLEAKETLCLKCGEGSIQIRADGKILIQGKDLVSRALRMNRIKGGAVSIN